ncbi:MAG: LptF/LptG family permease [Bacteroidota bacterium]
MVKKIDWMVLRAFIGPFLMSFAIILFILVMQFMSLYMNDIIGKGLGIVVLGKLIGYAGGRLALTAMPVAILAAGLMTFGSMGEHYELAALKSCGIGVHKIGRSVVAFSLLLLAGSIWLSYTLVPQANLKFFSLLYDVQRKKADLAIKPGHFYWDIDEYVIRVSDKDLGTGMLYDVLIYDHTENRGNNDVLMADSASTYMEGNKLKMVLYHGVRHEAYKNDPGKKNHPYGRTYFDSLYYRFDLSGFDLDRTDESQFRHQITLTQAQLSSALDSLTLLRGSYERKAERQIGRYTKIDSAFAHYVQDTFPVTRALETVDPDPGEFMWDCVPLKKQEELINRANTNVRAVNSYLDFMTKKKEDQLKARNKYLYEYYFRLALPVNCVLFMLIGISLGAIIRKGGLGMPAIISIVLFLAFYVLTTYGKKFAKEGVVDPWTGAWFSVLVFTPLALVLTYQATTDARILDATQWKLMGEKIWAGILSIPQLFSRKQA